MNKDRQKAGIACPGFLASINASSYEGFLNAIHRNPACFFNLLPRSRNDNGSAFQCLVVLNHASFLPNLVTSPMTTTAGGFTVFFSASATMVPSVAKMLF